MSKHFQPLGKRILIQLLDLTEQLKNGIIVPVGTPDRFVKAKVHIVPKDVDNFNAEDLILVDRYLGSEVELYDQKYLLVKADDVIAKFEETKCNL